jgi:RimJ/RimL family protein N-acetyltransferase
MHEPIYLENDQVTIHGFRPEDLTRYEILVKEIYQLFSDAATLQFLPEKRLNSVQEADKWLKNTILNFYCQRNFLHFITDKKTGELLGMIDIFTPSTIQAHYRLPRYTHFIEFYLRGNARGKKIMSRVLPDLLAELQRRGITEVGAAINVQNTAARKVLTYSGFRLERAFDSRQEFYHYQPERRSPAPSQGKYLTVIQHT